MGSDDFVARMQAQAEPARLATPAIPKAQRRAAPRSWPDHLAACGGDRNAALCAVYRAGPFTMPDLASLAGLSVSQVGRIIAAQEWQGKGQTCPRSVGASTPLPEGGKSLRIPMRVLQMGQDIQLWYVYQSPCRVRSSMQVSKWGNSLAIRLPAAVVGALALKAGDEVEVRVAADNAFEISPKPTNAEVLARLRQYRGTLPADFKFDRLEAYERPQGLAAPSPPCRPRRPQAVDPSPGEGSPQDCLHPGSAPAGVKQSGQATFA